MLLLEGIKMLVNVQMRQSFDSLNLAESTCQGETPWIIPFTQSYIFEHGTWSNWWYSTLTSEGFPREGSELITLPVMVSVKRWRTFQEPSFSLFLSLCPLISRSQIPRNALQSHNMQCFLLCLMSMGNMIYVIYSLYL